MSRITISPETFARWSSPSTKEKHRSEDPKGYFNTQHSCHLCGRYEDRPSTREAHYINAHAGARFCEQYTKWTYNTWSCHACGKDCETENERNAHYARFHPGLAIRWKQGQPQDAHQIRYYWKPAEEQPTRDPIGASEVIQIFDSDNEDEIDLALAEVDELEPSVMETSRAESRPAARLLAFLGIHGNVPIAPVPTTPVIRAASPPSVVLIEDHPLTPVPQELQASIGAWRARVIEGPEPVIEPQSPISPTSSLKRKRENTKRDDDLAKRGGTFQRILVTAGVRLQSIGEAKNLKTPLSTLDLQQMEGLARAPCEQVIEAALEFAQHIRATEALLQQREEVFELKKVALSQKAAKMRALQERRNEEWEKDNRDIRERRISLDLREAELEASEENAEMIEELARINNEQAE